MSPTADLRTSTPPPEQGQLVSVRQRHFVVTEIARTELPERPLSTKATARQHLISLSCVEDDGLGEDLQVIWEIEQGTKLIEKVALPEPTGFDDPARLNQRKAKRKTLDFSESAEYPSGLRGRIANPLFVGSNPTSAFSSESLFSGRFLMIVGALVRLIRIALRDKPPKIKASDRYHVTLDMTKVRPDLSRAETYDHLLRIGFTPTAKPDVWKVWESGLTRVPEGSIVKAEKL